MKHILRCVNCNQWSMTQIHSCGAKALSTKPLKYTPDDKYASYRRKAREATGGIL
ncbi:MAG: nucleolar RNA-binding Nop10p family protein [Candidatus Woesearchaeota archaeon]|nr:nucleolar RNA-binding Nop10p family protein [Candidatus Woesearchaeota archaeon]